MKKVALTKSEIWVIAKALQILTSDIGAKQLLKEFPDMDFDAISEDIDHIIDKIS